MKSFARYLPLCLLGLCSIQFASAQSSFDLNVGFGSFHDKAAGIGIDSSGNSCGVGSSGCQATPSLSGFFMGFGGDLMLKKHLGVGAEWVLTPTKSDYASLPVLGFTEQYRQHFIDINGIYAPINGKKAVVKIMGGIGDAKTSFALKATSCLGNNCQTQSQAFTNSNHFQIHAGIGVELFVTAHVFIRPQFDLHYVPNLKNEFGSNVVPGGMVWLGYSFGDR